MMIAEYLLLVALMGSALGAIAEAVRRLRSKPENESGL